VLALPIATGPEKPRWGEPCNGCGFCCAAEVCAIGLAIFGKQQPAPALEFDGGRFWCGAVRMAERDGCGPLYRMVLGIGMGCDSKDPAA
jgi:hypothetical protein